MSRIFNAVVRYRSVMDLTSSASRCFRASSEAGAVNPPLPEGRLGIRNLNFGGGRVDLVRENGTLRIRCDFPMTVFFKQYKLECKGGENVFPVPG